MNEYDKMDNDFKNISGYTVHLGNKFIGYAAIKVKPGAVVAYVHELSFKAVRGTANGGGYDRTSAAIRNACEGGDPASALYQILKTLDGSQRWDSVLNESGYQVCQAI